MLSLCCFSLAGESPECQMLLAKAWCEHVVASSGLEALEFQEDLSRQLAEKSGTECRVT